MYVCMYVSMYVCTYMYMYICILLNPITHEKSLLTTIYRKYASIIPHPPSDS